MDEEQFNQLRHRARRNEAPAEILAAVELEPGLVTRASEGNGQTILHSACGGGHVDLARDLVDRQADVHQRSTDGFDALMFASIKGHIPVMEFLLSRGAEMTFRGNNGYTALGLAAVNAKLPACKYLISRGSDLMAKNNNGKTALALLRQWLKLPRRAEREGSRGAACLVCRGPAPIAGSEAQGRELGPPLALYVCGCFVRLQAAARATPGGAVSGPAVRAPAARVLPACDSVLGLSFAPHRLLSLAKQACLVLS